MYVGRCTTYFFEISFCLKLYLPKVQKYDLITRYLSNFKKDICH